MSDLHIGTEDCDVLKLRKHIEQFKKMDALVMINGDLFDAILPTDERHELAVHVPLVSRNDRVNQIVEEAAAILEPIAKNIIFIGVGNHEEKVTRRYHVDLLKFLVYELRRRVETSLVLTSYHGLVQFHVPELKAKKRRSNFDLYYHHGWGGSPKSGTKMTLNELRMRAIADVYWIGHKHQTSVHTEERIIPPPNGAGRPEIRVEYLVSTGSYLKNTVDIESSYVSYSVRRGMITGCGVPYVLMHFEEDNICFKVG